MPPFVVLPCHLTVQSFIWFVSHRSSQSASQLVSNSICVSHPLINYSQKLLLYLKLDRDYIYNIYAVSSLLFLAEPLCFVHAVYTVSSPITHLFRVKAFVLVTEHIRKVTPLLLPVSFIASGLEPKSHSL